MTQTAAVIVIGNEVLAGKVEESNAVYFVSQLRDLGVALKAIHVIPDEVDVIAATVEKAHRTFDVVFTSGGVGPTHDDMTMPAIARGLGMELVKHPKLEEVLVQYCKDKLNDYLMRMAFVPAEADLLWDGDVPFPCVRVRNVYIFPGDPGLLRRKFMAIRDRFRSQPFAQRKIYTTCDEGELAALMEEAENRFKEVEVGSYPVYDKRDYKVKITVESKDAEKTKEVAAFLRERIPSDSIIREE